MRFNRMSRVAIASILFGSLFVISGCDWIKPGDIKPTKANDSKNTPAAPVVVDGTRTSFADIVEKTSPAVVQITAAFDQAAEPAAGGFNFPPLIPTPRTPTQGAGSGVIVSKEGIILTNHHVIDRAKRITVEMSDGRTFEAEVVGSDKPSDLAVIKIKGEDFPFLNLGDSDKVRVGDIVLAIGNPLGIGQSVTSGIISAKSRTTGLADASSFQDFLQTDAPINQGNSGGALVNVNGELIGINSQILSRSGGSIGIGFAVPSNMAANVMNQLIKTGKVRRGMLGVNIQRVNPEIAKQFGVEPTGAIVSSVLDGSAADKAGVKRGDIITIFNGQTVEEPNALRNTVAGTPPGTDIKMTVIRNKKEIDLTVKLDEYKSEATPEESGNSQTPGSSSGQDRKLGISVQPLTPELAKRFNVQAGIKGLVITEIDPRGPAAENGLAPGDVILEVNRQIVESIEDMRAAIDKSGDGAVLLLISREGRTLFLTVRP